jgi:hypothetical protein
MTTEVEQPVKYWISIGLDKKAKKYALLTLSETSYQTAQNRAAATVAKETELKNGTYVIETFNIIKQPSVFAAEIVGWFMSEGVEQAEALKMCVRIVEELRSMVRSTQESTNGNDNKHECGAVKTTASGEPVANGGE